MAKITVAKLFETVAEVDKRSQVALMQSEDSIQISEKTRTDLERLIATLRTDFTDSEQTQEIIRADKEEDNTITSSFFELQKSFDGLVGTVDILRTDLDNLYQAFYTSQIVRQEQLEKEEDAVFKEQDDLQKKRGGKKEGRGVLSNMIRGKKDPNQIQQDRKKQVKSLTKSVLKTLGLGALAGAAMGFSSASATDSSGNVVTDGDESSSTLTPSREELIRQTERGSGMSSFREDAAENAALQESVRSVVRGKLSPNQIAQVAKQAGFPEDKIPLMVAIAMAESGGDSEAHNPKYPDNSFGLWQINMLDAPGYQLGAERRKKYGLSSNEQLKDPLTNAKAALDILNSQGLGAWSVYTSGAYKNHLSDAQAAVKSIQGTSPKLQPPDSNNSRKPITAPQLNQMMNGGLVPESQSPPGPQSSINSDETSKETKTSFNFFSDRGEDKLYTPSNFLRASYTSSEEGKDIASLQSNRSPNVSVVNLTQGMDGGTQVQQSRGSARTSVTPLSNTTNLAPVSLMTRNTFLT